MNSKENLIAIDRELCTGCRRCAAVCPVDAITGEEGKPQKIDTDRCVLCGQCVQICSAYASAFDEGLTPREAKLEERGLLQSVKEPFFAAYNAGHAQEVKNALASTERYKMVQCAPAVRVSLAEEFGFPSGMLTPGKMAASLRRLGFDKVYDTNFAADLTIMEEGSELIKRVSEGGTLPMFTSCCPAWVKYVEQEHPELTAHLSSCKSPQQMSGAIFKTYGAKINAVEPSKIFNVSIMPCTCKKFECNRKEMADSGYKDVDVVLTTRELAQLIKDSGIDFANLPDEAFDLPLGSYSGAGTIFGTTGGVMEAALRTGYELITGKPLANLAFDMIRDGEDVRTAAVQAGELELRVAVVSGLKNAAKLLDDVKAGKSPYHFIEVMTCPGGCVNGGGQPKSLLPENRGLMISCRKASLYQHDTDIEIRKSHENPDVKKLYEEFLGEPLGSESHHLLHTKYVSRKAAKK